MLRRIIKIDSEKCNGCGLCVDACHEGAIFLKDGKATLLRDDYCDGLGDCLPACPVDAISFEEREALPYDEAAVEANMAKKKAHGSGCACQSSAPKTFNPEKKIAPLSPLQAGQSSKHSGASTTEATANLDEQTFSALRQWPVQIKLAPVNAAYFAKAKLLIAADCAAYAYGNFHADYMQNKITLIGCPKLDEGDYSAKLLEILKQNDIKSVTVARMSVPCCGGLEQAVIRALKECGKMIPWQIVTISPEGKIIEA